MLVEQVRDILREERLVPITGPTPLQTPVPPLPGGRRSRPGGGSGG